MYPKLMSITAVLCALLSVNVVSSCTPNYTALATLDNWPCAMNGMWDVWMLEAKFDFPEVGGQRFCSLPNYDPHTCGALYLSVTYDPYENNQFIQISGEVKDPQNLGTLDIDYTAYKSDNATMTFKVVFDSAEFDTDDSHSVPLELTDAEINMLTKQFFVLEVFDYGNYFVTMDELGQLAVIMKDKVYMDGKYSTWRKMILQTLADDRCIDTSKLYEIELHSIY